MNNPLTTLREEVYKALREKRDKDSLSFDPVQDDVAFVFDETISRTLDLVSEEVNKGALEEGIKWMQEGSDKNRKGYTEGFNTAREALLSRIQELKTTNT